MPDYSKGKIYAIRAPGTDAVYIGSTCSPLSVRMSNHRADKKRGHPCSSSRILDMSGAYIELIEDFPCDRKEQLNRREGEIIRATPAAVNRQIAGRTEKEKAKAYYAAHREQQNAKNRKWATEHPEQMREYSRRHREKKRAVRQSANIPAATVEQNADDLRAGSESLLGQAGEAVLDA